MKEKFNIIFLDIDGVLNGYNKWNLLGWNIVKRIKYKPLELWYKRITKPFGIHESKVKRLAKIVKATNAKIVMTSSWRYGWWNLPYEEQYEDQKQLTDLLNKYIIEVIDITPALKSGVRGKEIKSWLHKNRTIVRSFVILDDDVKDMHPYVDSFEFINTSNGIYSGLTNKHVDLAICKLQIKSLNYLL